MSVNNKTEFLFESDAEKVILKEAEKKLKRKKKKRTIFKITLISIFFVFMFVSVICIKEMKANKLKASTNLFNKEKPVEMEYSASNIKKYTIDYNDKYSILINKKNPISKSVLVNYNIVKVKNNTYKDILLEENTYKNYIKLKKDLTNKDYIINITCGFESSNASVISEHNTGLAFNIIIDDNKEEAYEYIENIAYLYGFIVRYPKGKEKITGYEYEPKHLRYVGYSLAKYLKRNNMTLEEYHKLKTN